jgi:hypothetical protein
VLHTRITDELSEDIRRVAEGLRIPVSNLVRNVLEEVFDVVEAVTDNVGDLVEEVLDEADRVRERLERRHEDRNARVWSRDAEPNLEDDAWESRAATVDVAPEPDRSTDAPGASAESASPVESGAHEAERPDERPRFPEVLGWQRLTLNTNRACAACGRGMARGEEAFLGISEDGPSRTTLCPSCVPAQG